MVRAYFKTSSKEIGAEIPSRQTIANNSFSIAA